jgi:VanZ family protein
MHDLRYPWFWWLPGVLIATGIAVGSLLPGTYVAEIPVRDKVLHALAYFTLMLWFAGIFRRERHWMVAALVFSFGLLLDLAQSLTESRSFELADVAADAGGILAAFALSWFLLAGWCRRVEQLLVP